MKLLVVSQGRIACANVLSDLYAMGITECDNMLMLLSLSQKMNEKVTQPASITINTCVVGFLTETEVEACFILLQHTDKHLFLGFRFY